MSRKNAISLLMSVGLISGCTSAVDTPVNIANTTIDTTANPLSSTAVSVTNIALTTEEEAEKAVAIQAMNEMSHYLRSLKSFQVVADVSHTETIESGQTILLSKKVEIKAERPSKLWAKTSTHYEQKEFFFDGQTFSLYTPNLGYYTSFNAPGTVSQVVLNIKNKHDIDVPIVDLFLWGTAADDSIEVDRAVIVGVTQVNGISCNQFAFSEKNIDWQICIRRDGKPLPLRFAIFEKGTDAGLGQMAILNWDTAPNLLGQTYTFVPKAGDEKIAIRKVAESK
ncbi:MAG: DUF2092 domain-containing protein [Methyloprofundus sp.]|nr:DUF2092 domain-containing protein [Methyloprofundus sp.]